MNAPDSSDLARQVVELYTAEGWTIATVESCTGGLIAAALTEIPGSSAVFERGFVTYSNAAKSELVGVDPQAIEANGAVSEIVARRMAEGGRDNARVDVCISVTGVAGPGGGTAEKPVGLVHFACATSGGTVHLERRFGELDRARIRTLSVKNALTLALEAFRQTG